MSPRLIDTSSLQATDACDGCGPSQSEGATTAGYGPADVSAAEDSVRKRRGLAIFAVLLAIMLACATAFFMSSKHLSMAAAFVDETVGTMESYTVVVFKGTGVDPTKTTTVRSEIPSSAAISSSTGSGSVDADESTPATSKKQADQLSTLPPYNTMQEAFTSGTDGDISRGFEISEFIMSLFARASKQTEANAERLYVSDINDIYSAKGAQTITISIDELDRYSEPVIYSKGDKDLAIFSVEHYISRAKLNSMTRGLRDKGVDFIIAIAPRTEMVSTFDDIDACIITSAEDEIEERASRKTLAVNSPFEDEVGALIITSNNIASLKTIKEL